TTVLPEIARRSPATSTPPENLNAKIVVASVGFHNCSREFGARAVGSTVAAGLSSPLRRRRAGKSSLAPEKLCSSASRDGSITGPYAGDSASIDWDRPCASFLEDLLCPAAKRPVSAARRHRLASDPTEPDRLGFERAQAYKNLERNAGKANCAPHCPPWFRHACQRKRLVPRFGTMKLFTTSVVGFFFATLFGFVLSVQTRAQTPATSSDAAELEALAKKIDAQTAKIDTLSQQILKLEQQIA